MAGQSKSPLTLTRAEAVRLLGLAGRTFDRLVQEGTFVPLERGRGRRPSTFDAPALVAAYLRHRERRATNLDLAQERARLARAQRRRLELETAQRRGRLAPVDEFEARLLRFVDAAREAWLTLAADAVSAGLIPPEREQALDDLCRARLAGLAEKGNDAGGAAA